MLKIEALVVAAGAAVMSIFQQFCIRPFVQFWWSYADKFSGLQLIFLPPSKKFTDI